MFGALGRAVGSTSIAFISARAREEGHIRALGLTKQLSVVRGCRDIGKRHMKLNDALPKIEVDPETYQVRADGELLRCEPAKTLPLTQRYTLFLPVPSRVPTTDWLLLQLADSAFPAGGFAHSGGLEAMAHAGEIADERAVERFAHDAIWQAACAALPLILASHNETQSLDELDALAHATLWSEVSNRASRTQGRAFLDAASRIFPHPPIAALRARLTRRELRGHVAPLFGSVTFLLGISPSSSADAYLHLSLRGVLSAAVRLGLLGPYEAQAIQHRQHASLTAASLHAFTLSVADIAQTSPIAELLQAGHDRLYSRLFQS